MADCMEKCSRYWGNREGCYGVVWVEGKSVCWIRTSGTSTKGLVVSPENHSALVDRTQMAGYDTKCPAPDASIQTLSGVDGLGYTMNCNKSIQGLDACYSGVPQPCTAPFYGYHHTETMEQCLRICVDSHPLCKAVTWSPDLKIGWANCWLKTGFSETSLTPPKDTAGVLHTATITRIDPVDDKCPSSKTYVSAASSGNKNFDITCGQVNSGTNITSLHTQNVTACMDACAVSDQGCKSVVFDAKLGSGFRNCYLQNTTNTLAEQPAAMYAVLNGSSPSPSAAAIPNAPSNTSSPSRSKAWIAGPVLGGLALLALLAFLALYLRKRKARATSGAPLEKDGVTHQEPVSPSPAYSPGGAEGYYPTYSNSNVHAHHMTPVEMAGEAHEAKELSSTKYAFEGKGPAVKGDLVVQELP
jgi:hypothetical protein